MFLVTKTFAVLLIKPDIMSKLIINSLIGHLTSIDRACCTYNVNISLISGLMIMFN